MTRTKELSPDEKRFAMEIGRRILLLMKHKKAGKRPSGIYKIANGEMMPMASALDSLVREMGYRMEMSFIKKKDESK